jgi:large subunit ribosomal protein L21
MYAVIKAGGKQHRVQTGDIIEVELVHGGDDAVQFHPLLVVDDDNKTHVGKEISKAVVHAKLVGEQKGEKVKVFKYRNKTGYSRRQGHRQMYTLIEIGEIKLPGVAARKPAAAEKSEEPAEPAEVAAPKRSSAKATAAAKTAAAATKTAAAAEPEAAAAEDEAAEPTPAETPPAEVAEVAAEAETGPEAAPAGDTKDAG